MTREIDRDGNVLIHIERFIESNGNVVEKRFTDYTEACGWRINYAEFLSETGERDWKHEMDSEWVKEEVPEHEGIECDGEEEFAAEHALMCEEN